MNRQTCPDCLRYRARIHELASNLDKIRQRVVECERSERINQEMATRALKRLYGDNYWKNNSYNDRHLIGLGIRTLFNVGISNIGDKLAPLGFGKNNWGRIKYKMVNLLILNPLRKLVGISKRY